MEERESSCIVGMYIGEATMENSMEVFQTITDRTTTWSNNSTLGINPKKVKTRSWKYICTLMFIAELFIMVQIWKQPVSIDKWMAREGVIHTHTHTNTHTHTLEY